MPLQPVEPLTFTPAPFGLLSVVQTPSTDGTNHWRQGVKWVSRCMIEMGSTTYDPCTAPSGAPAPLGKTPNVDVVFRGATPFTTYVRFDCSPVGNEEAQRVGRDALAQSGTYQVERSFWTGQIDDETVVYPHLAADDEVVDPDGNVLQSVPFIVPGGDVATALGELEAALADCYNGVGVIHVPLEALPTLDAWGLLRRQGAQLQTLNGNLVAAGAGYPGTAPDGTDPAPGTTWLYATGAVFMYRGNVSIRSPRESFNRELNTVEMIAERTYVLGFDCCHLAVEVTLGVPTT